MADRYLYVTRDVDGGLLGLLDDTRQTVGEYQRLEQERGRVLLGFRCSIWALRCFLRLAAMWLGLWFADRLSRPIGRLAEASEQVGKGNLDLQIPEPGTGDEIRPLAKASIA